jgi:uncharacterized repeat protein (TIGR03803 family)
MIQKWAKRRGLLVTLALSLIALFAGIHNLKAYSFQELYRFPNAYPSPSGLTLGSDGAFYGTSETDGDFKMGFVFRVTTNGAITTVVSFAGTNGAAPLGGLVRGSDGALYGTASQGGAFSNGTVFRVTTNGILTTLISFTGTNAPYFGGYPVGLGVGGDGALYGSTYNGGIGCDCGTAFRVTIQGQFSNLGTFSSATGYLPNGALTQGPDGAYYGTTGSSGPLGYGTIFRTTLAGALTTAASFDSINTGAQPLAKLMLGFDGALYGTTYFGGTNDGGTIFKFDTNGTLTALHNFYVGDTADGYYPEGGLIQADDGTIYGTAQLGASTSYDGTIFKINPDGSSYARLVTFTGSNGADPVSTLIFGLDGALYGSTPSGGVAGAGTVFRMTLGGTLTTLASFRPSGGTSPNTPPLQTPDGMLYGTTSGGGSNGMGTVFALSPSGTLVMSVSLDGVNGSGPSSPLILGADGNLYGTAGRGGVWDEGTFYRVTTNGVLTALASFDFFNSGANPGGPMAIGSDGAFYGTANNGGSTYVGTVFRATTNGSLTGIASFDNTHGADPQNGLIRGADGAFYGTTTVGGTNGAGVVFRVTMNGVLSTVTSFNAAANLGNYGRSTLVQSSDGTVYGTTYLTGAGNSGYGTVFKVTTNGVFTKIATLLGYPHESYPTGPLVIGPDQALYGTTISGGQYGVGTLFRATTNGAVTTLISFWGNLNGEGPVSGLTLGQNNKLYGTCSGGQGYAGTVFSLDLSSYFLGPPVKQGNTRVLSYSVIPMALYRMQRAGNLNGPWSNLGTAGTAALSGIGQYTDTSPPATNAFYRLIFR